MCRSGTDRQPGLSAITHLVRKVRALLIRAPLPVAEVSAKLCGAAIVPQYEVALVQSGVPHRAGLGCCDTSTATTPAGNSTLVVVFNTALLPRSGGRAKRADHRPGSREGSAPKHPAVAGHISALTFWKTTRWSVSGRCSPAVDTLATR